MDFVEIADIVNKCYSECPRSLELYHDFAGFSLDECVENFVGKIKELPNYTFHKFEIDGDLVGYYAFTQAELPFLYTFFIRPKYRKSEIAARFWAEIMQTVGDTEFMSGVFETNLPARKYLTNNGGVEHIIDNASYYIFNRR